MNRDIISNYIVQIREVAFTVLCVRVLLKKLRMR